MRQTTKTMFCQACNKRVVTGDSSRAIVTICPDCKGPLTPLPSVRRFVNLKKVFNFFLILFLLAVIGVAAYWTLQRHFPEQLDRLRSTTIPAMSSVSVPALPNCTQAKHSIG